MKVGTSLFLFGLKLPLHLLYFKNYTKHTLIECVFLRSFYLYYLVATFAARLLSCQYALQHLGTFNFLHSVFDIFCFHVIPRLI